MKRFEKIYHETDIILTEGAFVERLKSEFHIELDPALNHSGLIYTNPEILEILYRQYIDIGLKYNIPIMITTPTRKVNSESMKLRAWHWQCPKPIFHILLALC